MAIIYTKHAKEMLSVRDIKEEFANKCAENPDRIFSGKEGLKIYLKDLGVNYLKLVVAEEGENIMVITVHWLDKKRVKK